MDAQLPLLNIEKTQVRLLLPLKVPEGEFLFSEKESPNNPWKVEHWTKGGPLPPHSENTLEASIQFSTAEPGKIQGGQFNQEGIDHPMDQIGLKNGNRWVIISEMTPAKEVAIEFHKAGILSTKVGLAFIWIDLTIDTVPASVLFDLLKRVPNHFKNKRKGTFVHQVNPHPKARKDYPKTTFTAVELLDTLSKNVTDWSKKSKGKNVNICAFSRRVSTYATLVGTDYFPSDQPFHSATSGLEWHLEHGGYQLLNQSSPSWKAHPSLNAQDRYGFWGRGDSMLYVGTGIGVFTRETLPNKFFDIWEHFLSFSLAQGTLTLANHIEDDLKEVAANRNLEAGTLRAFRKRFEAAEWTFLQLQWNLDHTLLHLEPVRFNIHNEYRALLGIPQALDRIQAQSELINAYFTRKFERSLQTFVLLGAVVGAVTALGGINVRHLTSEAEVGLTQTYFALLAILCIGALFLSWLLSTIIRHPSRIKNTGLRIDGWGRWFKQR